MKRILIICCFILWFICECSWISTAHYMRLVTIMPDHTFLSASNFSDVSVDVDFDWYVFNADESETKEFRSLAAGKVYDLSDDSAIKDKYGYEEPFSIHLVHYEPLNENNTNDGCRISVDSVTDSHGNVIDVDDTFEIRKGHGIEQVYNYAYKYVLSENYAPNDALFITKVIKYFPSLSKIDTSYWVLLVCITVFSVYLWFKKSERRLMYVIWTGASVLITSVIIFLCVIRMSTDYL